MQNVNLTHGYYQIRTRNQPVEDELSVSAWAVRGKVVPLGLQGASSTFMSVMTSNINIFLRSSGPTPESVAVRFLSGRSNLVGGLT